MWEHYTVSLAFREQCNRNQAFLYFRSGAVPVCAHRFLTAHQNQLLSGQTSDEPDLWRAAQLNAIHRQMD